MSDMYRELKERAAFEPPTYMPASRAIVIDGFTIPEVERSIPNGIVRPTPFHREDRQPLTHPFALALYRCHSERSRGTSLLVPSANASQPAALFAPAHVNVDEKSLSFRDWKISDPSSAPLSQNATIPGLVVRSGFINISNEVGRVKSVSLFFYFFRTHLYSCAVPLLSLTGDAPQFSGCSSCPTYGLGSCHFIVSVLSTRHLSDHVRP
jgi:hypothetical protein